MADRVIPGIYRSYRKYKGVRGVDAKRSDYRRERRAYLGNAEAVANRLAAWDTLSGRYWNVGRVAPVEVRDDAWLDSWGDEYVSGLGDAEFDAGRYRDLYGRRHYDNYVGSLVSEGVPEEEADAMYWERFPAGPVDASSSFGAGEYFGNERGEAGAQPVGFANMYFKYLNPLSAGALMGTDALVDAYRSGDWSSVPVDLALAAAPLGGVKGFVREAAQGVKEAAKNNLKRGVKEEVNDNVVKTVEDGVDDALELMRDAQGVSREAAGKPEAAAQALQYLFKPYRGVDDDVVGGIYYRPKHPLQYKSGSSHAGKSGFGRFMERVGRGGVRSDVFVRKADLDAVPGLKLKTQAVKTEGLGNDARAFRKSVGENANPKDYVKVSTEDFLRSKAQPGEAADRLSDAVSAQLKAKTVSGVVPAYFNKYTQRNPWTFWRWNAGMGIGSGLVSGYRKAIGYGQNRDEWNKYTEGVANSGYNEFDSWINRQDKAVRDNAYRAVLNMRGEPGNEDESRYRQAEDAIVRQLVSEGYSADEAYRMFNAWASGIMGIGEDTPDYYKCGGKLYADGGNLYDEGGGPKYPWHPPMNAYQIKGVMPAGMLLRTPANGKTMGVPERSFRNDGPTVQKSELIEDKTANHIRGDNNRINHAYDIPYIDSLEITIPKYGRVSTNALDSIAKYSSEAGIPLYEGLGLAAQETHFGAMPWYNFKRIESSMTEAEKQNAKAYNRALANTSYFRNYGVIPANYIVRDYAYMIQPEEYKKSTPPLLHAFQYWKSGKYNSLDKNHTSDVKNAGKSILLTKAIQDWIEKSEYAQKALDKN